MVMEQKKTCGKPQIFLTYKNSRSASLNFAGLQALSADIDLLVCTVNLCGDMLDIRLPHMIGSSVGMGYIVPEMSTFTADLTLGHPEHLLIKDCTRLYKWLWTSAAGKSHLSFFCRLN